MTTKRGESLGDIFAEEEARRLEEARREIAEEKAAWDALPEEERERITAEREAKWAELDEACKRAESEEPDEDDDEEESE